MKKRIWWGTKLLCVLMGLSVFSGCVTKAEYTRLQRALGQEIIRLRQGQTGFQKDLDAKQKAIATMKQDLAKSRSELAAIKVASSKQKRILEDQIKALKASEQQSKEALNRCGQMAKGRGKKLVELQAELNNKQKALLAKQQELQSKVDDFNKREARLKGELTKKENEIKAKEVALAKRQSQLKASLQRVTKLETQIQKLRQVQTELMDKLKGLVQAGKLNIKLIEGQLVLQLPEKILFSSGSSRVKRDGKSAIQKVTEILRAMRYRWQITGHTDTVGRASYNWRLSANRALSVLFVMLKAQMPPEQISVAGFGQYQPRADNDTKENKAMNRRTELVLVPDLSDIFQATDENKPALPKPGER